MGDIVMRLIAIIRIFSQSYLLTTCYPLLILFPAVQVHVIKPSHKSALNSKIERPVPDNVAALLATENVARDVQSEFETVQDGKIREIVMDNADSEPVVMFS